MAANALTLSEYLEVTNPVTGQVSLNVAKVTDAINRGLIEPSEGQALISQFSGKTVTPIYDATTARRTIGSWQYAQEVTYTTPNSVNSNAGTVSRGTINKPISTTIDPNTGKVVAREVVGKGSRVLTGIANVASWAAAASVGITLGKTIDGALYNANPDFFDSIGMSSLNPETWASITNGIDYTDPITGTAASAFNFLFDIDPNTGETQAYMRDDAFAYLAAYFQSQGAFNDGEVVVPDSIISDSVTYQLNSSPNYYYSSQLVFDFANAILTYTASTGCFITAQGVDARGNFRVYFCSTDSFTLTADTFNKSTEQHTYSNLQIYTINPPTSSETVYYAFPDIYIRNNGGLRTSPIVPLSGTYPLSTSPSTGRDAFK